jgi:hypothetical protein
MFFKVIGKLESVDQWGRYFIDVMHIKDAESLIPLKNDQIIIKFSEKHKELTENMNDDKKVYYCHTYDWNFKGKKGVTYYCYKIQNMDEYYFEQEAFKNKRKSFKLA